MNLADRIQLILQQWLAANNEDAMWLRGPHCRERQAAYERALNEVHRRLIHGLEWREWVAMQDDVVRIVREFFEKRDSQ